MPTWLLLFSIAVVAMIIGSLIDYWVTKTSEKRKRS